MRFLSKLFYLLIVLPLLAGCAVSARHPSLKAVTDMPPLIPVRDFVANRGSNFSYKVSPDGKKLAWLAVKGVSLHLYVKNLETNAVKTIPADQWYMGFAWAQDSRHLISDGFSESGTENNVIISIDTEQSDSRRNNEIISPFGGVNTHIQQLIPVNPDNILITHNQRDKTIFDLYRLNITTKEQTLIAENPGNVTQWITSSKGELVGRVVKYGDVKKLEVRQSLDGSFRLAYQWTLDDTVNVVSITDNGDKIYLLSNMGRDRIALVELDTQSGLETVIHNNQVVDISHVYKHPTTGKPLIAFSDPDYPEATTLGQPLLTAFDLLKDKIPANINIDGFVKTPHNVTI